MLEEFIMEKKQLRSVQVPGKGPGTDTKKSQDGAGGKAFPRSSRRRETAGTSTPKYDPVRKQTAQKGKAFDKRPRPRGPYMECRKEGPQVAQDDAEYGSVISPGGKKQNLNHLLNFHYAPREGTSQHWRHNNSGHGSGMARFCRGTPHKYNKEQFLQANCQFAVKADGDYRQYLSNPDQLVDWGLVEQIRIMSPEETTCPICLYPPVASKMTRCGHIFCWPCILHYLALSDKSWRKCPICYESVHKQDLKSVLALKPTAYSVGGEITLRLMRRERGSLEAVPVEQWDLRPPVSLLSVSESAVDTIYAKLLLADTSDVLKVLQYEKAALDELLKNDEGSPEVCFLEQAMDMLLEREASLKGLTVNHLSSGQAIPSESELELDHDKPVEPSSVSDWVSEEVADVKVACGNIIASTVQNLERPRLESTSSEDNGTTITAEDLEHSALQQPLKHFYFYQAMDGQHIYLHAINARMLEMAYGSLGACPLTISGRIVEKEMGSMTEDLRKRLRYMQHLPVTCQFEVVEIVLDPSIIPAEIREIFQDQVEARRRRRQKRAREEMRREKKINEEENRRWGRHPTPHIRIASHHHFPIYGNESSPPLNSIPKSPSVSSLASTSTQSPLNLSVENLALDPPQQEIEQFPPIGQESSGADSSGPSFAQMLRTGKISHSAGAWGRASAADPLVRPMLNPSLNRQRAASDSEPEPEGYVPAPTYSQSFSDAIAIALAKSAESSQEANAETSGGGKKKKKQKPKVLFSTSMACTGK